jgi:hypothetical protein
MKRKFQQKAKLLNSVDEGHEAALKNTLCGADAFGTWPTTIFERGSGAETAFFRVWYALYGKARLVTRCGTCY